jgi:hypothetical protein
MSDPTDDDYLKPSLTVYGSLSDLTEGNGPGYADGPAGGNPGKGNR